MVQEGGPTQFRVLVLDGGGIRGYYTAALLARLARHYAESAGTVAPAPDLGAAFDLLCGSSAGAILACTLAAGLPAERAVDLYRREGPTIFPRPSPLDWRSLLWCVRHWRAPTSNAAALRGALERAFGGETLGAVYERRRIAVCLTTTDLSRCRLRLFRTPHRMPNDATTTLVDACMASSAAPILFKPVRRRGGSDAGPADELLCDGGVSVNNPIQIAMLEALALAGADREVRVLSIGSCASVGREREHDERPRGLGYWVNGLRLLHASLDAQSSVATECARALAPWLRHPTRVVRLLDPELSPGEADLLRIDNAAPEAFAAMDDLAQKAAALNVAHAGIPGDDLALLPEFFGPPTAIPAAP